MEKCSYADKYKAIHKPKCGCDCCWEKWLATPTKNGREKSRRVINSRESVIRPKSKRPKITRTKSARIVTREGVGE